MKPIRKPAVIGAFATGTRSEGGGLERESGYAQAGSAQFARILVPSDFSDPSRKALKYAARLAAQFGSKITLLHVLEPSMSPDFASFPLVLEEEKVVEGARQRLLSLAKAHLDGRYLAALEVRSGNPFHEIAEAARELSMDLIVMATHGYTGVKRVLLGSTTERVVRYAQCPVLVVR
jgi:universal stress protein A